MADGAGRGARQGLRSRSSEQTDRQTQRDFVVQIGVFCRLLCCRFF